MVRKPDMFFPSRLFRLALPVLAGLTLFAGMPPASADATRGVRPGGEVWNEAGRNIFRHAEVRKFEGVRIGRDVYLEWTTLSEASNQGFEVQRASSESRGWEDVGFVQGMGDSGDERRYQFRDRDVPPEDLRYMLRVRAADGMIQYSQIISVPVSGVLRSFRVDDGDGSSPVRIATVELAQDENVSLLLTDYRGNLLGRIADGTVLSGGRHNFPIDFSRLPEGRYQLDLHTSEGRYRRTYEYRK